MITTDWAEISCEVPTDMVDSLASFLIELTGSGVSIDNLHLDTFSLDSLDESLFKSVKAYLPFDSSLEEQRIRIEHFLLTNGPSFAEFVYIPTAISVIRDEDWANNWKLHFKPVRIGEGLIIKPTWEEHEIQPGDLVIEIDPGMAFGTGAHPTTRMCLEVMERLYIDANKKLPNSVLDVGTGSGVLSIAAARMGATFITAVDIDPVAIRVTLENLMLNGVSEKVSASTTDLLDLDSEYGLVVANILAEELVRLARPLTSKVEPGGWLILSGILIEKESFVCDGFKELILVSNPHESQWSCLLFRKPI